MQIPSFFYGLYKDVKYRCRKMVTSLARGQTWYEAMHVEEMIDTENHPGLIVLDSPSPLLGGSPHFHCYVPLMQIFDAASDGKIPIETKEKIFEASLQSTWGLLSLLSQNNCIWVYHQEKREPFLQACIKFWDTLVQNGDVYSNGSTTGESLWYINTNLKYVLANKGVSTSVLTSPLPAGGLLTLVTELQQSSSEGTEILDLS
jgi:hypothetical protein